MMEKVRLPIAIVITFALLVLAVYLIDFDTAATVYRNLTTECPTSALQPNSLLAPDSPNTTTTTTTAVGAGGDDTRKYYVRAKRPFASCAQAGTPAKSFLMVFMSRSGSTAISQTLSIHSRIENKFEFLHPLLSDTANYSAAQALNMTRTFFDDAISRGKIPGYKVRSIHIFADPQAWEDLAREYDTRIIWQYRKNLFKTALGIYAEEVYDDDTATGGIKVKDLEKVDDRCDLGIGCSFAINEWGVFHEILTSRIRQDVHIMRAVKVLDGGRDCTFELPYEDYLYHKEDTLNDLFTFLGLQMESTDTYKAKATGDSLCDVVENFDELCTNFYGCPVWQPFLEDFENDCRCTNFTHGSAEYCSTFGEREMAAYSAGNY